MSSDNLEPSNNEARAYPFECAKCGDYVDVEASCCGDSVTLDHDSYDVMADGRFFELIFDYRTGYARAASPVACVHCQQFDKWEFDEDTYCSGCQHFLNKDD